MRSNDTQDLRGALKQILRGSLTSSQAREHLQVVTKRNNFFIVIKWSDNSYSMGMGQDKLTEAQVLELTGADDIAEVVKIQFTSGQRAV